VSYAKLTCALIAAAVGLVAVTGCRGTPGNPVAASGSPSFEQATSTSSGGNPDSGDVPSGFENLQQWLCDLIPADVATSMSLPETGKPDVKPDPQHSDPQCRWRGSGLLAIAQFTEGGSTKNPQALPDHDISTDQVGGRPVLLIKKTSQPVACEVDVDSGSRGVVAFSVAVLSAGQGKFNECDVVRKLAETAMRKIPG
jgi:hypothetical protein